MMTTFKISVNKGHAIIDICWFLTWWTTSFLLASLLADAGKVDGTFSPRCAEPTIQFHKAWLYAIQGLWLESFRPNKAETVQPPGWVYPGSKKSCSSLTDHWRWSAPSGIAHWKSWDPWWIISGPLLADIFHNRTCGHWSHPAWSNPRRALLAPLSAMTVLVSDVAALEIRTLISVIASQPS